MHQNTTLNQSLSNQMQQTSTTVTSPTPSGSTRQIGMRGSFKGLKPRNQQKAAGGGSTSPKLKQQQQQKNDRNTQGVIVSKRLSQQQKQLMNNKTASSDMALSMQQQQQPSINTMSTSNIKNIKPVLQRQQQQLNSGGVRTLTKRANPSNFGTVSDAALKTSRTNELLLHGL